MTHNFCRTFAKAVSRSRLCPHRMRDLVLATSHSELERRHLPKRLSPTLFDSGCSGKLPFPMVRHCSRSVYPRKGSHRIFLASRSSSGSNDGNKPPFIVRKELRSCKYLSMFANGPKRTSRPRSRKSAFGGKAD